jgi:4-hydroxy-tetrahydrodipicolinate reductase
MPSARGRGGSVRILLLGAGGKVGEVLGPALEEAGHDVTRVGRGEVADFAGHDAAIDFTLPDAVRGNVEGALGAGVPCIVGTTGLDSEDLEAFDSVARERGVACFVASNFALGAVLMMRFAAEAVRYMPSAEIVELHDERKVDAPSGTSKATAEAMGGNVPIHSIRLPGLVAHQEVLLGGPGQLLTIRHDTMSREAFVPGVLLALEKLPSLDPGLTVGLDTLLD